MTALLASEPEIDPRDPELRLAKLFDDGTVDPLAPRDSSGVLAARGTINRSMWIQAS